MNKLNKTQIDNIKEAVNKATDLVFDDNLSPSEAIAKTASAMRLTPDYVPIIIQAFNNGAAEVHRKDSHTLQEKAADYPIAQQAEVFNLLGKPLEKKATYNKVIDTFYDLPIEMTCKNAWSHLDKYKYYPQHMEKIAEPVLPKVDTKKGTYAFNLTDMAKKASDEATRIKYAAVEGYEQAYKEVETELRKYAGIPMETAVMHAKAAHGNVGVELVMDIINKNNLEKNAGVKQDIFVTVNHPFAIKMANLVTKFTQLKQANSQEAKVTQRCLDAVISQLPDKEKPISGMEPIDAMFKEGSSNRKKKDYQRSLYEKRERLQKSAIANPFTGISGLDNMINPTWSGLNPYEYDLMRGLNDPMHEARLRKIRVQSILTDLMNTDDYLKEKDPEEVLDAANDILEINKSLHNNKPLLRAALRQYLESDGLDIPTLGLVSDLGSKQRDAEARARESRNSMINQNAIQAQNLTDKEKDRAAQKEQNLDKLLADALSKARDRKSTEKIEKKKLKATAEEGKASRELQLAIANMTLAATKDEGGLNRDQQLAIANMNDATTKSEGGLNRDQQLAIANMNDATTKSEGGLNRDQQLAIANMNDATTQSEGDLNRQNQLSITALNNNTAIRTTGMSIGSAGRLNASNLRARAKSEKVRNNLESQRRAQDLAQKKRELEQKKRVDWAQYGVPMDVAPGKSFDVDEGAPGVADRKRGLDIQQVKLFNDINTGDDPSYPTSIEVENRIMYDPYRQFN